MTLSQQAAAMAAIGVDLRLYSNLFPGVVSSGSSFSPDQQEARMLQVRQAASFLQNHSQTGAEDPNQDGEDCQVAEDKRNGK